MLAALESRLAYLLLLGGFVDAAPVRVHEGGVQTGVNVFQVATVLLTVLLVIWIMEHQAGNKRKRGGQRGMSRTYAKKVQKYFECLLNGTPWVLQNGDTEALSVEIIDDVLNDSNNATAIAIRNHPDVSRLIEDVTRRKEEAAALTAGGAGHSGGDAGDPSDDDDEPVPPLRDPPNDDDDDDVNAPLLGGAQKPRDEATARAHPPPPQMMHAAPSAGHEVQRPAEKKPAVAIKIPMPKTVEEMWSRLNVVADELGISRQAAMQQGYTALECGQQLNRAEKQLRMIAGAD